jgi:hypothetical protein
MAEKRSDPNRTIPLRGGRGMWSGGDAAEMPDGYARRWRNIVLRSRVAQLRPQLTYDGRANVRGLGLWYDELNRMARLVAADVNSGTYKFYAKGTSGETWSEIASNSSGIFVTTILDQVSYRGSWFASVPTVIGGSSPAFVNSYDGTTFKLGDSLPFAPYSMTVFKERMVYGGVRFSGTNLVDDIDVYAYDAINKWTRTTTEATEITGNGTTTYRITPTATTGSEVSLLVPSGVANYFGSLQEDTYTFLCELGAVSESYDMPVTVQVKYASARANLTEYAIGQIVVPATPNGLRYRCTVAGTSDAAPPVYPTALTSPYVTDGTVTWMLDGSDVANKKETKILAVSKLAGWTPTYVTVTIPNGADTDLRLVIKFGTTATPTITLAPLDFAFLDGLPEDDPRKRNHGQQFTPGDFTFPFFSNETTDPFVIDQPDHVYLSEPLQPRTFKASRNYRLTERPGAITAARAVGEKLALCKAGARWLFGATESPSIPILPEGSAQFDSGPLNPKAGEVGPDGAFYYVGDTGVFRWDVVRNNTTELCGDAMRDEIMNKNAASWCESQPAPANRALLAIDQRNREMYVYTQKGKWYVKSLDAPPGAGWVTHDAGGGDSVNPVGYQICDMAYNPTTGNMYFAFTTAAAGTAGLARLDPTVTPAQDSISTSGTLPVWAEIWPRPIEAMTPSVDVQVNTIRFYHKVTESQAGQTMRGDISFDQGVSFTKSLTFDLAPLSTGGFVPLEFPTFQAWNTIQTRLVHSGEGGAGNFAVSRIEADIMVLRGYYPKSAITSGASTL